jgi:hypothetical protein
MSEQNATVVQPLAAYVAELVAKRTDIRSILVVVDWDAGTPAEANRLIWLDRNGVPVDLATHFGVLGHLLAVARQLSEGLVDEHQRLRDELVFMDRELAGLKGEPKSVPTGTGNPDRRDS